MHIETFPPDQLITMKTMEVMTIIEQMTHKYSLLKTRSNAEKVDAYMYFPSIAIRYHLLNKEVFFTENVCPISAGSHKKKQ